VSADAITIAITYAGLIAFGVLARRASPSRLRAALRGAWCAAWLVATDDVCVTGATSVASVMTAAAWASAAGLVPWSGVPRVASMIVGPVAASLVGGPAGSVGVLLGITVARAMERRVAPAFRLAAYWASFAGTTGMLLPLLFSCAPLDAQILIDPTIRLALAALLALAAIPLAIGGIAGLTDSGGTPEPLDPPPRLCTSGLYAHLRHPIQLGEILLAAAGAVTLGTEGALFYAAGFAIALLGPLRIVEERRLAARFGADFEAYRRDVPAYVPRLTRAAVRPPVPIG
jgi:protein-S-isoprenylcysteine O-methyltransferase Ste14